MPDAPTRIDSLAAACDFALATLAAHPERDYGAAIGGRPILLMIGQELPPGREFEFIQADLDRYAANPRLTFGYTGMHGRRRDRPLIREIHRRLDAYWDAHLRA